MAQHGVAFGLFGNIHEAGGHGTDLGGKERLAPNQFHPQLYLNIGPADGVRWVMNDGTESVGMAAVVTINKAGKAQYVINRVPNEQSAVAGKTAAATTAEGANELGKGKGKKKGKKKGKARRAKDNKSN